MTIELPPGVEENLRKQIVDLDLVAKEALVVELYRQGAITSLQLANVFGLDRFSTDAVLKRHGVHHDQTFDDVCRETDSLRAGRSC